MLITMLKTTPGSLNGIHIKLFKQGQDYDMPDQLAASFINCGAAEKKMIKAGYQNKMTSLDPNSNKEESNGKEESRAPAGAEASKEKEQEKVTRRRRR